MDGSRIQKAKQSLILFLKSLPQTSLFNIISFGTQYVSLWEESRQYTQDNLQEAIQHVKDMQADMGGTNIYNPLKNKIYNSSYGCSKDTTLNVFLLTDGEDNADPIIELVKNNNRAETRIYTLGIGERCSFYLIKRVAEVGNGKFHIVGDNEDINEKVIDLLEDSLTPYLEDFKLETNVDKISSIIPNPESIVSLKKNQELTIQILFSNEQELENIEFSIHCYNPQDKQPIKYSVNLNLNQSQDNEYFHKLATHKFITYYDNAIKYGEQQVNFIKLNKQNIEDKDIVNLSIENQILSNKTAFVCEVCELEDQLKQQARSKIKITHTKKTFPNQFGLSSCQFLSQGCSMTSGKYPSQQLKCMNASPPSLTMSCGMKAQILPMCGSMQSTAPQMFGMQSNATPPMFGGMQSTAPQMFGMQSTTPQMYGMQSTAPLPPPPPFCNMQFPLPMQSKATPPPPPCNMQFPKPMQMQTPLSPKQPIVQQMAQKCSVEDTFSMAQQCKNEDICSTSFAISKQPEINNLTYENLMNFAQADGRFQINNDIQLKVNYLNLSNSQGLIDDVWNTLLILLYLEKFCSQFKKSWQLIFSKGVQYLLQNGIDYKQKKQELNQP
ncbi:unnamed protein product (macronuclear) [Paramecium tetraurelia]|uniref:VWFA domain-containing protein n=1 Tax=Paramecium tetraurelia TaxID=5888 RepID=A0BYA6_PARTE|nr:uncharacterized protein GSPATT00033376001 [Paramecium tetraurelia]CAK63523.1 unnamed protein product [Paramecium tetraurelia]|eukprot:XP_001430921.1 hypothetical protein (macronuclear) [Paramecium tetraurelia strain d4-2]